MTDLIPRATVEATIRNWLNGEMPARFPQTNGEVLFNAIAAIPPAQEGEGWQPIETAPKDGTPILIWEGEERLVVEWKTRDDQAGWIAARLDDDWFAVKNSPTHWRHLPEPPASATLNKGAQD